MQKGSFRRSSLKDERRPSSVRRTLEPFQSHRPEGRGGAHMGLHELIDTILNLTEPNDNNNKDDDYERA